MIKRPSQRVAVFIDTQNMYHSAKHVYGARVNFGALVEAAVGNRQLIRAVAYVAKSKTGEESAFFEALMQSGIELRVKDVQEFSSGAKKADWDVGMAVDAISISGKVDAVVLVTGDGDFVPLAQYLQNHGVLAEVVAFAESANAQLREIASSFLDLSEDPAPFLIGYLKKPRRRAAAETAKSDIDLIEETLASRAPSKRRPPEDIESGGRKIRITY